MEKSKTVKYKGLITSLQSHHSNFKFLGDNTLFNLPMNALIEFVKP